MKNQFVHTQAPRGSFARLAPVALLTAFFAAAPFHVALAQVAPTLNSAQSFAVLAGTPNVTNTGPTVITGDLGIHPALAVTGFPPGTVAGAIHAADAVALQAKADLVSAYDALDSQGCNQTFPNAADLVGLTLGPGVYCSASSLFLSGTLTLDAQFNPNAVWVFKTGSTLITASNSTVLVINDGQYCNVFWEVGSSATLGTTTTFIGNILALTSISLNTGAKVSGRVLARNGAVTMDTNTVAITACAVPPAGPIPPTVGKDFGPAVIDAGGTSILTITLSNPDTTDAAITSLTDSLPVGVLIGGSPVTTCPGGSVSADTSSVTLTGGSIPAHGSCTVTVPVTSSIGGLHTNTLGIGALLTSNGPNAAPAVATLNVVVPNSPPTLVKAFSPGTINAGGVSTLTITLSNPNSLPATLTTPLIDTLPAGVVIASPSGADTTCSGTGAVVAPVGGSTVTLPGTRSIPANGSCTVTVNVTAPVAGNFVNALSLGNNPPAVATLVVVPVISPPPGNTPGLSLSKTANPTTYTSVGQVIVYTYVLKNISLHYDQIICSRQDHIIRRTCRCLRTSRAGCARHTSACGC
ncbi:MAG: ice-binding family protein [Vicinamibacterales bacterium]